MQTNKIRFREFFFIKKKMQKGKINSFPRDNQPIKCFHFVVRTR